MHINKLTFSISDVEMDRLFTEYQQRKAVKWLPRLAVVWALILSAGAIS
jgi:hypothetical protein